MGCTASSVHKRTKEVIDADSILTDEASVLTSASSDSRHIDDSTQRILGMWLDMARATLAARNRVARYICATPAFGFDTPGFGTQSDSVLMECGRDTSIVICHL